LNGIELRLLIHWGRQAGSESALALLSIMIHKQILLSAWLAMATVSALT
jgi:hypothetical protein